MVVGQFPHHKWVGKMKEESLVQPRTASPSPIDEAGQGTTWYNFYEMPCFSDHKCLCQKGREAAYTGISKQRSKAASLLSREVLESPSLEVSMSVDVSFRDMV